MDYAEIRQRQERRRGDQDYYSDIGPPAGSGAVQDRPDAHPAPAVEQGDTLARARRPTREPPREVWSFQPPWTWPGQLPGPCLLGSWPGRGPGSLGSSYRTKGQ